MILCFSDFLFPWACLFVCLLNFSLLLVCFVCYASYERGVPARGWSASAVLAGRQLRETKKIKFLERNCQHLETHLYVFSSFCFPPLGTLLNCLPMSLAKERYIWNFKIYLKKHWKFLPLPLSQSLSDLSCSNFQLLSLNRLAYILACPELFSLKFLLDRKIYRNLFLKAFLLKGLSSNVRMHWERARNERMLSL